MRPSTSTSAIACLLLAVSALSAPLMHRRSSEVVQPRYRPATDHKRWLTKVRKLDHERNGIRGSVAKLGLGREERRGVPISSELGGGTFDGIPGYIDVTSPLADSEDGEKIASLVLAATGDRDPNSSNTTFTLNASSSGSSQIFLVPLVNITTPLSDPSMMLVNLKVPIFNQTTVRITAFCATFDPSSDSAALTVQRCGNETETQSQRFLYDPARGMISPAWPEEEEEPVQLLQMNGTTLAGNGTGLAGNTTGSVSNSTQPGNATTTQSVFSATSMSLPVARITGIPGSPLSAQDISGSDSMASTTSMSSAPSMTSNMASSSEQTSITATDTTWEFRWLSTNSPSPTSTTSQSESTPTSSSAGEQAALALDMSSSTTVSATSTATTSPGTTSASPTTSSQPVPTSSTPTSSTSLTPTATTPPTPAAPPAEPQSQNVTLVFTPAMATVHDTTATVPDRGDSTLPSMSNSTSDLPVAVPATTPAPVPAAPVVTTVPGSSATIPAASPVPMTTANSTVPVAPTNNVPLISVDIPALGGLTGGLLIKRGDAGVSEFTAPYLWQFVRSVVTPQ